jgi:hypothetical protein
MKIYDGSERKVVILVQARTLLHYSVDRGIAWSVLQQVCSCVWKNVVLSFYSSRMYFTLETLYSTGGFALVPLDGIALLPRVRRVMHRHTPSMTPGIWVMHRHVLFIMETRCACTPCVVLPPVQ